MADGEDDDCGGENVRPTAYTPAAAHDCLLQAYYVELDSQARQEPPLPYQAVAKAPGLDDRRIISKWSNSRARRARASDQEQRDVNWEALRRRADRAESQGRVRFSFWRFGLLVSLLCEADSALPNLFLHIPRAAVGFPTFLMDSGGGRGGVTAILIPVWGRRIQWGKFIGGGKFWELH